MPIEKLEIEDRDALYDVRDLVASMFRKLNEVVGAVNEIKAYLVPTHPDSALGRIDAMLFEQPPESVQQDKGLSFDDATKEFAYRVMRYAKALDHAETAKWHAAMETSRLSLISAAQREYSQAPGSYVRNCAITFREGDGYSMLAGARLDGYVLVPCDSEAGQAAFEASQSKYSQNRDTKVERE